MVYINIYTYSVYMHMLYRGHVYIYMCEHVCIYMHMQTYTCMHYMCKYLYIYTHTRVSGMQHDEMTAVVNNTFQKLIEKLLRISCMSTIFISFSCLPLPSTFPISPILQIHDFFSNYC